MQRVQVLLSAELAYLVYPVACQSRGAHNYRGQRTTVYSLGPGILLCPAHKQKHAHKKRRKKEKEKKEADLNKEKKELRQINWRRGGLELFIK